MKYYGYHAPHLSSINNSKYKTNLIYNKLGIKIKKNFKLNRVIFYMYLPPYWNFIYFKINKKFQLLHFYSSIYYFRFVVPSFISAIKFTKDTNGFFLFADYTNNFFKHFLYMLKRLFFSFSYFFFKKIKFKGKGYYIFKNKRNTITFRFGYSHRIYLYFFGNFVKFLAKTSIFIFGINYREIVNYGHRLVATRPYNLFTGKGVRFTRQILYKKIGKVGSYR